MLQRQAARALTGGGAAAVARRRVLASAAQRVGPVAAGAPPPVRLAPGRPWRPARTQLQPAAAAPCLLAARPAAAAHAHRPPRRAAGCGCALPLPHPVAGQQRRAAGTAPAAVSPFGGGGSSASSSGGSTSDGSSSGSSSGKGEPQPRPGAPIVVVAGWLGAPERPFSKYVDLWRARLGAAQVLPARPSPAALILPAWGAASSSRFAAAVAGAAAAAPGAPLLVHLFSGGGFLYTGLVLRALQERGDLPLVAPRIAGVILDSSPAFVTADVSARALLAAALREPAAGVEDRHPRLLAPVRAGVDAYLALPSTRRRLARAAAAWRELAPACPKLYLYSESDVLVSPDTIQGAMAAEAVRGSRVYAHKWADTPHVEHYRLHPEQYTTIVDRFVSEALATWRATSPAASRSSSSSSLGSSSAGNGQPPPPGSEGSVASEAPEGAKGAGGRALW